MAVPPGRQCLPKHDAWAQYPCKRHEKDIGAGGLQCLGGGVPIFSTVKPADSSNLSDYSLRASCRDATVMADLRDLQ